MRDRDVGWFGKVVGVEGETFLVRNRLLNGRGPPNRVSGQYLRLQTDFGLQLGSEERVHYRTLSKRTRERLLASSDEHNSCAAKKAVLVRELKKVKLQKSQEKEAYDKRRQQLLEQGTKDQERNQNEYDEGHLVYWQLKAEGLQDKMKAMKVNPHRYPNPNPNPNHKPNHIPYHHFTG